MQHIFARLSKFKEIKYIIPCDLMSPKRIHFQKSLCPDWSEILNYLTCR